MIYLIFVSLWQASWRRILMVMIALKRIISIHGKVRKICDNVLVKIKYVISQLLNFRLYKKILWMLNILNLVISMLNINVGQCPSIWTYNVMLNILKVKLINKYDYIWYNFYDAISSFIYNNIIYYHKISYFSTNTMIVYSYICTLWHKVSSRLSIEESETCMCVTFLYSPFI